MDMFHYLQSIFQCMQNEKYDRNLFRILVYYHNHHNRHHDLNSPRHANELLGLLPESQAPPRNPRRTMYAEQAR